VDGYPAISVS